MSDSPTTAETSTQPEAVDLYARGADSFVEPPRSWLKTLRYLGPGLILVGSIVGSGELIMTTKLGAQAGYVLLWFVLISCVVKTVVQAELARHVISSGETILVMFNKLPGPRVRRPVWFGFSWMAVVVLTSVAGLAVSTRPWANSTAIHISLVVAIPSTWILSAWLFARRARREIKRTKEAEPSPDNARPMIGWYIWLWLACQLVMFINGGAILGGAGQAAELAMRRTLGPTDARWWTLGVAALCAVLLLVGRYRTLERVSVGLVCTFTFITIVCTALLQWTGNAITWEDVRGGLEFGMSGVSAGVLLTALAMYAGTGIGTWEMMHYTYWCVEKGYARNAGARQPGQDWPRRARGWIRVMYTDVLLTMAVFTLSTICFYLLGAAVLYPRGLDPDGQGTIAVLENIYTATLGPSAATLFVVGAFMVLFSTAFSSVAGTSRLMADGLCVLGITEPGDYHGRLRFIRFFVVFSLLMNTATYWCLENPPVMLIIASFVSVILYPILGLGTLYLRYRGVDERIRPGRIVTALLWICGLTLAFISPAAALTLLAIQQGWLNW